MYFKNKFEMFGSDETIEADSIEEASQIFAQVILESFPIGYQLLDDDRIFVNVDTEFGNNSSPAENDWERELGKLLDNDYVISLKDFENHCEDCLEVVLCACSCDCDQPAKTKDDCGIPVCWECKNYTIDEGGEVVCAKMTDSFSECHECGETIEWNTHIQTKQGFPNWVEGECSCKTWMEEDRGGWGNYTFKDKE